MTSQPEITTRDIAIGVGDAVIRTYETGGADQPAILWLHGSGPGVSALSNWSELITSMPGYHHVAPDVLGFGDSSHPDDLPLGVAASAAARADAMLALLDALGIERAHLIGNSMGGMISLRMLQTQPERFDRVVLMGSGGAPMVPTPDLVAMVRYYDDPSPDAMLDLLQRFMVDTGLYGDRLGEIVADRAAAAARDDVRRSHLRTFSPEGAPLVFTAEELAAIPHPVLVVHGREDRIIPKEASYHLAAHLPDATLTVLPHAGHWVQIEQVDRFRALAELFLTSSEVAA